jgi:2-keto-4-pentenoate hydratase
MTPTDSGVDRLSRFASALAEAYVSKSGIEPLSATDPTLTLDDAYAIQLIQVQAWCDQGATIQGYKVGLTSQAMQDQLGVHQPDFGHLTQHMFHLEHAPIAAAGFLAPKVEPEIAFVMGRELAGPGVNVAQAIRAVEFVLPSLELIDSRVRDWKIGLIDTVSDNASAGGVILGSQPKRLTDLDLTAVECGLSIDGRIVAAGVSSAVLGSPINALVWLANTLGTRGVRFQPGDVILPGSITVAQPVGAGTVARADFARLGSVTATFA